MDRAEKEVEFKKQCFTYTMGEHTFDFLKKVENGSLEFNIDYSDNTPCVYNAKAQKITVGGQGIEAILYYVTKHNGKEVSFSLSLPNQGLEASDDDYITFTHILTRNDVLVYFKNTTGETKLAA